MPQSFRRTAEEVRLIEEIRGSSRNIREKLEKIDWFHYIHGSDDCETLSKIHEKIIAAEVLLKQACSF